MVLILWLISIKLFAALCLGDLFYNCLSIESFRSDTYREVCFSFLQRLDVSLGLGSLRLQLLHTSGELLLQSRELQPVNSICITVDYLKLDNVDQEIFRPIHLSNLSIDQMN